MCKYKQKARIFSFFILFGLSMGLSHRALGEESQLALTVEASLKEIAELRASIDKGHLEPMSLVEQLDYDETLITDFVQNQISYHHYKGVLRGARGTLRSRSGNMLDQSLLLATLLKDAGLDARIVRGEIEAAELYRILSDNAVELSTKNAQAQQGRPRTATSGGSEDVPVSLALQRERKLTQVRTSLETLSQELYDAIEPSLGSPATGQTISDKSMASAFWVEYRLGGSAKWTMARPALDSLLPALEPKEYFTDSIPEEYQQRISLGIYVEAITGGSRATNPLFVEWERPLASLVGENSSLTLSLVPDNFLVESAKKQPILALIDSAELFMPFMNGQPMPGASLLARSGSVVPANEAMSMFAGIFKTVTGKGDAATNALSSIGSDPNESQEPLRHIQNVSLRITVSAPGQDDLVYHRTIAQWQGNQAQLNRDLTREITLSFQTGVTSPIEFADLSLDAAVSILTLPLQELADYGGTNSSSNDTGLLLKGYEGQRFLATVDMHVSALGLNGIYRTGPTIVAQYRPLQAFDQVVSGFDIITSPWGTFSQSQAISTGVLNAGVLGAIVERNLFAYEANGGSSALSRLMQNRKNGEPWQLVNSANNPNLKSLSAEARGLLQRDLEQGYVFLFTKQGEGISDDAWWRVRTSSGELIPSLNNGWGGVISVSAEVVENLSLREWLAKMASIHGGLKVYGATTGCGLLYASAKIDDFLGALGAGGDALGEAYEQTTGDELGPCMFIPDEAWRLACKMGLQAAAAAKKIAEATGLDNLPFTAFMKACVAAVISAPV